MKRKGMLFKKFLLGLSVTALLAGGVPSPVFADSLMRDERVSTAFDDNGNPSEWLLKKQEEAEKLSYEKGIPYEYDYEEDEFRERPDLAITLSLLW